jgi:hypothetical protein
MKGVGWEGESGASHLYVEKRLAPDFLLAFGSDGLG